MSLSSWLRFPQLGFSRAAAKRRRGRGQTRLYFEGLEDRTLLSTLMVLNLNDNGAGSLRQAVLDANAATGADVISYARGLSGQIMLASGELTITDDLAIDGPGASKLTISGNQASRVFSISGTATDVAINDLTIANGLATGATALGGGILNRGGHLSITQVMFSNNQVMGDGSSTASAGGAPSPTSSVPH